MIKAPDRIMYHVRDMARAQAFYRDVLGLKPKEEHPQFSAYELGPGLSLALHAGLRETPSGSPVLCLEVADIEQARRALKAAGAEIIRDHYQVPGGMTLDFKDPEGYRIQLVQFTQQPRQ